MNLVFIVGTGRCGSTLITELLSAHPDFGFISNVDDNLARLDLLGRYNNWLFRSALGRFTEKGGIRYAPSEAFKLISRQVSPIYADSSRDLFADDVTPWLQERFQRFFEKRGAAQGKPVFLHKYTGWSRIGFFSTIFPDAKFVNVVRDGRAVANSWLQMPWWGGYHGPENWRWGLLPQAYQAEWEAGNRSFVLLAAISWKLLMDSYEQAGKLMPPERYMQIRYEDFVNDGKGTLEDILQFSGLPWTPAFESSLARKAIHDRRAKAYQKDLNSSQLRELENSLGDRLNQHGYLD